MYNSESVLILLMIKEDGKKERVNEAMSVMILEVEDDKDQLIREVQQTKLAPRSENEALVSITTSGLVQVSLRARFSNKCPCKVANVVMDVFPGSLFNILIANASNVIVHR